MNKKFNFIVLFVLVIALFSACKEPEISQIIPVKVSFYDGDTLIESSYKNPDTIYDFPANPQKNGYTFAGWELNGELIPLTQKTYSLPQSSYEYTFKATWNKNSMTVSFYDGATLIESKEILAGAKYTFPTNPTKSDCIFLGWKINDELIPLDQTTYSHEHSEEGYKYEAIWEHLYLSIDSTGAVTCKDKTVTTVVIPEYVNGIKVTSIAQEGFKECESLTSIIIPDGVTSIGMQAFINCTSLESINIPDSVTEIGLIAFYGCSSLTEITMPDSVTSISSWTFQNCTSLTSITIPDSVTSIGNYAFCNCSSLTEITIPDSVNGIGKRAFDGCSSLTEINANPKWTSYFDDQSNIKKWIIPDNVTSIGSLTFQHCTFLTSITIPDSVTSIGDNAFYNCSSLVSITIPDSVTEIGRQAFRYCTSLTEITIPDSVTSIGAYAFLDCSSLESIYINNEMFSIAGVPWGAENATVYWNNVPTTYHPYLSINSNGTVKCIDKTITEAVIPEYVNGTKVTSISFSAFDGCSSLESIYIDKEKDSLDLSNSGIPNTATVYWKNPALSIDNNGAVSCIDKTVTEVVIPPMIDGIKVTSIAKEGFKECESLTSIIIPDSVTSIGNYAFSDCSSLESIYIDREKGSVTLGSSWEPSGATVYWGSEF